MQQIKINTNRNKLGKRFIYYSLYGWGVPLTIVGIGQVMDISKNLPDNFVKPQFGVWTCWFYSKFANIRVIIIILGSYSIFIYTQSWKPWIIVAVFLWSHKHINCKQCRFIHPNRDSFTSRKSGYCFCWP